MKIKIAAITGLLIIPLLFYILLTRNPSSNQSANSPVVSDFCSPEMPESATVVAGYGKIINQTSKAIYLESIKCLNSTKAEFHKTTIDEDGGMEMEQLHNISIKPFKSFVMTPGGNHIMIYLNGSFKKIKKIHCDIILKSGTALKITSKVKESCD